MKNRKVLVFALICLFLLASVITYYWSIKSCSYCFQGYLAQNYIFQNNELNLDSEYWDNTVNIAKHKTNNFLGVLAGGIFKSKYSNLLFWVLLSLLSLLLFYRELFGINVAIFSALIYLTNPTLNVTVHIIFYYFLSLFLIYRFLKTKSLVYIALFILVVLMSINVDISPAFVVVITSFFFVLFYALLSKDTTKSNGRMPLYFLFIFCLIIIAVVIFFERNFFTDLIHRTPLFFSKLSFYVSSYPKSLYFYIYILSRAILIIIPAIYFYKLLKSKKPLAKNEMIIYSYFLTMIPLLFLFILFDITARIFDYYAPLLAAISLREYKSILKSELRKKILIAIIFFFILFSIFVHYIPPRSLEVYDKDVFESLNKIPKNSTVYADVFVANILISQLGHIKVIGPDYNKDDEYYKVYYEKDEEYIRRLFFEKKAEYFIISEQSLVRGLDILNAPHFLKTITIDEYDNMEFLELYYNNGKVYIWRINGSSSIS